MPKSKSKKKKQVQQPGIRVTNEAWELGKRIKSLFALTGGPRMTQGAIYTSLMLKHGPKMVDDLEKKYDTLRSKARK